MTDKVLPINALYKVLQMYECKNRITKAIIRMTKIEFFVANKSAGSNVYILCLTHNETRHCKNKTEALFQMRQPWVWCDRCAEINHAAYWSESL